MKVLPKLLLWLGFCCGSTFAQIKENPLLVVLSDTGQVRDGLPVLKPHPEGPAVAGILLNGFPLKMLRLYRCVQTYLNASLNGRPEPAYLLFSSHQGGFPRFGFYLQDELKQGIGYVDLFKTKGLTGRFSAVDQIFPHELGHIIVHLLSGKPSPGGANQLHAIAVRTDPKVAFQEGFAEHLQIMAVDDPDADPSTHALASDHAQLRLAERQLALFRRELQAYWSFATPKKMGFLFWYSGAEQVLRYHAVKANTFAYAPEISDALLDRRDPYAAYLLENMLPGTSRSLPKSASVMFSTEGCVSSLFYRWASDHEIGGRFLDESFYERFGAVRSSISPVENVYLKLFHAIHAGRAQDTSRVIAAYRTAFPEEAQIVDRIVNGMLLEQPLPTAPAIWLANPDFKTGTGLFDQFRAVPRVHTFDLNAATLVDLLGVPGIDRALAARILLAGPFLALSGLEGVQGMSRPLLERFKFMAQEMERLKISDEDSALSSLPRVVVSYLWRALSVLVVASISGGMFYRRIRRSGLFRSVTNGLAVSFLVVAFSWGVVGAEGFLGYLLPVLIFGLPSMLFQLARRRWQLAFPELLAWAAAALPARLLTYPWF
jgi:hypothetical protein